MLGFFPRTTVIIGNKGTEQWSITRTGKSTNATTVNSQFQCLVPKNTMAVKGDIITIDSQQYFVITLEKSFINTVCKIYLANCAVSIASIKKHYTGNVNDYDYEEIKASNVPSHYEDITAKMQMYDMVLIPKATRKFLLPNTVSITINDRIKFNDINMQVEGINASSYFGLLLIQCSNDTRKVKQ